MDEFVLRIFVGEVQRQCEFAFVAFQDIQNALDKKDVTRVFLSAHTFLIAVGMVSKLLWPIKNGSQKRGEQLRKILGVSDDSPIKSRSFRDHFEHYDERLDKWAKLSQHKNIADSNILPAGTITGLESIEFMRNLDPNTFTLTLQGDNYELPKIVEALKPIRDTAAREVARFHQGFGLPS